MKMESPIFIFSLPRSGSTLLQKILMTHEDIASIAEPWLLLPLVYSYKEDGALTEYGHKTASSAISEFIDNCPNKFDDYHMCIREFVSSLYELQCTNNERYFLDKTPRYYNIIPEIEKIFPNAKFIFLFRNPVSVMSSMLETWSSGKLRRLYAYERDLNFGLNALSINYERMKSKSISIRYEDLVKGPDVEVTRLCKYLDIPFDEEMMIGFINQDLKGKEGDQTGSYKYTSLNTGSLEEWRATFRSRFKRRLLYKYINGLDKHTLEVQGYNQNHILQDINNISIIRGGWVGDRLDYMFSKLVQILKLNIWFLKHTSIWASKKYLS